MNGFPKLWTMGRLLPLLLNGLLLSTALASPPPTEPPPELELLEFLGMFDDGTGATIAPEELLELDEAQWQETTGKEVDHEKK